MAAVSRVGFTVRNGTISGFKYGIYLSSSSGLPRTDVTATDVRLLAAPIDAWPGTITFTGTRQDACLLSGLRLVDGLITIERCTVTRQTVMVRGTGSAIRSSTLTGGSLTVSATDQGTFTRNVFDAFPMGLSNDSRRNLVRANVFKNSATAGLGAAETFLPQDANTIEDNEFTGNGLHPSGLVDGQGHTVQGGIHLSSRAALTPPATSSGRPRARSPTEAATRAPVAPPPTPT
ncbi:right-handed parallel beta-helix repeat-containing protein [Nonomuraea sp. NPDC050227]|uniref:right-handed parallel beta-helix repeat-containing protein n=1 Tax=Nonomuraea sp. NPDC050227 TaxID=3364360 RepID=UPI00379F0A1F